MPTVTITLIDTPTGGVAIKTDFSPAVGEPCSVAQAAALDIINRTRHAFGLHAPERVSVGVDIDAVHRAKPAPADWALDQMSRHVRAANPNMSPDQCAAYAKAELGRI